MKKFEDTDFSMNEKPKNDEEEKLKLEEFEDLEEMLK